MVTRPVSRRAGSDGMDVRSAGRVRSEGELQSVHTS